MKKDDIDEDEPSFKRVLLSKESNNYEYDYSSNSSSLSDGAHMEDMSSVEDGLVANRVRRFPKKVNNQNVLLLDEDYFDKDGNPIFGKCNSTTSDDWSIEKDAIEDDFRDIIDADFDITESDSEDIKERAKLEDKRILSLEKRKRNKVDEDLKLKKQLLHNVLNGLTLASNSSKKNTISILKKQNNEEKTIKNLYVVSDFGLNQKDQRDYFPGWKSAVNAARENDTKKKQNVQNAALNAYQTEMIVNEQIHKKKMEQIALKKFTKGKEMTQTKRNCFVTGQGVEMMLSWDGRRGIPYEENKAIEKGEVPPSKKNGKKAYFRGMSIFIGPTNNNNRIEQTQKYSSIMTTSASSMSRSSTAILNNNIHDKKNTTNEMSSSKLNIKHSVFPDVLLIDSNQVKD